MSKASIGPIRWKEDFKEWHITDVGLHNHEHVALLMRKIIPYEQSSLLWDSQIPCTIAYIPINDDPDSYLTLQQMEGFNLPILGVSAQSDSQPLFLVISREDSGLMHKMGPGQYGPEEYLSYDGRVYPTRVRRLFGKTYCTSRMRQIFVRIRDGRWEPFNSGLPAPESSLVNGFSDIDGFSPSDMYVAGGNGDIWYFNGERWMQLGFPSNIELHTVTCAGDQQVYLTGSGGCVWRGRESQWQQIIPPFTSWSWNDTRWFNNQLWLSSDHQVRILHNDGLLPAVYCGQPVFNCGHMDGDDEALVIASIDSVDLLHNQQITPIIAPYREDNE